MKESRTVGHDGEFESHVPSHAVGLSQVRSPRNRHAQSGANGTDRGFAQRRASAADAGRQGPMPTS
jgi:hypothetical protein